MEDPRAGPRSVARRAHPLTDRECLILDRIGRDRTHKDIAAELGVSINIVGPNAELYAEVGNTATAAAGLRQVTINGRLVPIAAS